MLLEQSATVKAFRESYCSNDRIVLYGTGINAEAIVKECKDYKILGLMDAARTGEKLWGLSVLSEEQVISLEISKIVIVARPSVHSIIYKRIQSFVETYGIGVYDIYGNDVSKLISKSIDDIEYFQVGYENLYAQIERYDVISFDIFDTLLCRKVYQPDDVFLLMKSEDICNDFVFFRENAKKVLHKEATIYEIYDYIRKKCLLSEEETQELLLREIQKEKQVLCRREQMVECFRQCIQLGKQVYLVSDMYMTKEILEDILKWNGIDGYTNLFISCEYNISKATGLFHVLKSHIGNQACLHIGDNHERDYLCAIQAGIDAFEIMSPIRMMEISTYQSWLAYTNSIENRVTLGLLASKIFNNPFSLVNSKGKPYVDQTYDFGYIYIAPLVLGFLSWLVNVLKEEKNKNTTILFASRDGYLFQKIYQKIKEKFPQLELPKDIYFLISRRNIMEANEQKEKRTAYLNYIKQIGIFEEESLYFVDFMSKGTCQYGLEKLLGRSLNGIYMQRSFSDSKELNDLSIQAFYKETNAMQSKKRIFAMCDFLECIFTAFVPSLQWFQDDGNPIYEEELRTKKQLKLVYELQEAIMDFVDDFYEVYSSSFGNYLDVEFCDEILRGTQSEYSRIKLSDIENINLDDAYGICRNTGIDIFR